MNPVYKFLLKMQAACCNNDVYNCLICNNCMDCVILDSIYHTDDMNIEKLEDCQ